MQKIEITSSYQQQQDQSFLPPFFYSKEDLLQLFQPDNIRDGVSNNLLAEKSGVRDGVSNNLLAEKSGVPSLLKFLQTDLSNGISALDFEERKKNFGTNYPVQKPLNSLFYYIKEALKDTTLQILCLAAIVSLVINIVQEGIQTGWMEGMAIITAVLIIVTIGSTNDYMKERQFAKLNAEEDLIDVFVLRDGERKQISVFDLLVGDLLYVSTGDIIPVDGILVKCYKIKMDESSMTGETDLIKKIDFLELNNDFTQEKQKKETIFLISGSKVMEGTGIMVVCTVGSNTQIGQLKLKLQEETPPTPLQEKLKVLAEKIGKIGLILAVITFLAMVLHLAFELISGERSIKSLDNLRDLVNFFLLAILVIVIAVPEGLPLAVTLALAYSVGKMKHENNFVKHLASCEIMGGANNICSDKTGTLTQNKMKVVNLFIDDHDYKTDEFNKDDIQKEILELLCMNICINSDATPKYDKNGISEHLGNKTECALLDLAMSWDCKYTDYRLAENIQDVLPFSSKNKRMSTIFKTNSGKFLLFTKGASEMVLDICTKFKGKNMNLILNEEKKDEINKKIIEKYSKKSLRTITLAYRELDSYNLHDLDENLESNLTLLAIAGVTDPLRPGVQEAIMKCKRAQIIVRMVTGDNLLTAVAIAKEAGIIDPNISDINLYSSEKYIVLEGKKFRDLVGGIVYKKNEKGVEEGKIKHLEIFKKIVDELKVLARSTPDDKYILVTGLKELQNVVAVTGDGTNDAPALKKADVGFAMGISGTMVARQAADIILLDDNFNSILTACKWGRNIYDSIRKFLQFQCTINVVALFIAFIGGAVIKECPLNAMEMLWVNLIQDTLASLALATEPPTEKLLERPPYGRNESLVTKDMWRNVLVQGVLQNILLLVILFKGPYFFGVPSSIDMGEWDPKKGVHYTLFFDIFVFLQVFNQINCRKLNRNEYNVFKGFFNNNLFLFIQCFIVIAQIFIVEFGGNFLKTTPLTFEQHLICIAIGSLALVFGLIAKIFPTKLCFKI